VAKTADALDDGTDVVRLERERPQPRVREREPDPGGGLPEGYKVGDGDWRPEAARGRAQDRNETGERVARVRRRDGDLD
jgi:hypothetical protein